MRAARALKNLGFEDFFRGRKYLFPPLPNPVARRARVLNGGGKVGDAPAKIENHLGDGLDGLKIWAAGRAVNTLFQKS